MWTSVVVSEHAETMQAWVKKRGGGIPIKCRHRKERAGPNISIRGLSVLRHGHRHETFSAPVGLTHPTMVATREMQKTFSEPGTWRRDRTMYHSMDETRFKHHRRDRPLSGPPTSPEMVKRLPPIRRENTRELGSQNTSNNLQHEYLEGEYKTLRTFLRTSGERKGHKRVEKNGYENGHMNGHLAHQINGDMLVNHQLSQVQASQTQAYKAPHTNIAHQAIRADILNHYTPPQGSSIQNYTNGTYKQSLLQKSERPVHGVAHQTDRDLFHLQPSGKVSYKTIGAEVFNQVTNANMPKPYPSTKGPKPTKQKITRSFVARTKGSPNNSTANFEITNSTNPSMQRHSSSLEEPAVVQDIEFVNIEENVQDAGKKSKAESSSDVGVINLQEHYANLGGADGQDISVSGSLIPHPENVDDKEGSGDHHVETNSITESRPESSDSNVLKHANETVNDRQLVEDYIENSKDTSPVPEVTKLKLDQPEDKENETHPSTVAGQAQTEEPDKSMLDTARTDVTIDLAKDTSSEKVEVDANGTKQVTLHIVTDDGQGEAPSPTPTPSATPYPAVSAVTPGPTIDTPPQSGTDISRDETTNLKSGNLEQAKLDINNEQGMEPKLSTNKVNSDVHIKSVIPKVTS